uniref:Uncharacterized protein n=1 Tax=viral metagenome TaxID=1070528 RepID=A0A6H2A1F0_9ZZZZ
MIIFPELSRKFGRFITNLFRRPQDQITSAAEAIITGVPEEIEKEGAASAIVTLISKPLNWMLTPIRNFFDTVLIEKHIDPDTGQRLAADATTASLGAMGIGFSTGLIGESVSFGQVESISRWPARLLSITGMGGLVAAQFLPIYKTAIAKPYGYWLNARFTPELPKLGDAVELKSRQFIEDPEFKKLLAYQGIGDKYISHYSELAITPLKYFAMNAIARQGLYDPVFFQEELERSGYSDTAIKELHTAYTSLAAETEIKAFKSYMKKAFKEGLITESRYRDHLKDLRIPDDIINIVIELEKVVKKDDFSSEKLKLATKRFQRGLITESEFRTTLGDLGFTAEGVRVHIDLAELSKKIEETEEAKLTRGVVTSMYRKGIIDKSSAKTRLLDMSYTDKDAELLLSWVDPEVPEESRRMLSPAQIGAAYNRNYIDEPTFTAKLTEYGYPDWDISILKELYAPKVVKPPKVRRPSKSMIKKQLFEGVISEEEARVELANLGYSEEDIEDIVALWLIEYEGKAAKEAKT